MTDRDLDQMLDAFLELGPRSAPDGVRAAAQHEARTTRQPKGFFWSLVRYELVAVATVGIVLAVVLITQEAPGADPRPGGGATPWAEASPWSQPSGTPEASVDGGDLPAACATDGPSPEVHPHNADYSIGRHTVSYSGFTFSFCAPADGWEPYADFHVSKSEYGPQGAEGLVFWASARDDDDSGSAFAAPCGRLPLLPERGLAADVAADIAAIPGTELISAPVEVSVGGLPAWHVAFIVREDVGCDPGFLYNWRAKTGGALWVANEMGDRIHVWILEVAGERMIIGGELHPDASQLIERQILQIVESMRFD